MPSRPAAHDPPRHRPVMLAEVLAALEPRDDAIYVDGTFGGGGYSKAILEQAEAYVYAIDRDADAIRAGAALAAQFPGRLTLIEGRSRTCRNSSVATESMALTASCSISECPRCSLATLSAGFHSWPTVRSTCA
jgi:16S rRNA C1402 N4-methylase RsmH